MRPSTYATRDSIRRHQGLATGLPILLLVLSLGTSALANVSAGASTEEPGFTYSSATQDILAGDTYYFVENDLAVATICTRTAGNNQHGTFQKGFVADFVHKGSSVESLDWTQFLISERVLDAWNYPDNNVALGTISVEDGRRVVASGAWVRNPEIEVTATYEMLPGAPMMRIVVDVTNTGLTDFTGYLEYQLDPDGSGNQNAYVPGIGWRANTVTSGWTEQYVYNGPMQPSTNPGHAIVWYADSPVAVKAPGYIFGAVWDISVPAGEQKQITFYHIVQSTPPTGQPFERIAALTSQIPTLDDSAPFLEAVRGRIVEARTGEGLPGVSVVARNIGAEVKGTARSDAKGDFSMLLPPDVYTLTASSLGYEFASGSINMLDKQSIDFAMTPITAWAGSGKRLAGSLVDGTTDDLVMENRKLAMAIAVTHNDPQLAGSTTGKPIDLAVQGLTDGVDWLNLPYLSLTRPQGPDASQITTVVTDSVEVVESTAEYAVVKADGTYREVDDVAVETVYTIRTEESCIEAATTITNRSDDPLVVWVGDAIDNDESGQISFVPGAGEITASHNNPAAYTPTMPWIAQYGTSAQCFGLIYDENFADFTAYGTSGWILSRKQVKIPVDRAFTFRRYIVAASTADQPHKSTAVESIFSTLVGQETGLVIAAEVDRDRVAVGEQVTVRVRAENTSQTPLEGYRATLSSPSRLSTTDPLELPLGSIAPGAAVEAAWVLTGESGGRSAVNVTVAKPDAYPMSKRLSLSVSGPGWYSGDNHMHSTWSDGSGTVEQNVASARSKGLDWITGTDHNTIRQADDLTAQSSADLVAIVGEEVTSRYGHSLAYGIDTLIDWKLPPQEMIDAANAGNNGQGFLYIAHPYYPGLEWDDWSVTRYCGLEVWNGFYGPKEPVNAKAFAKWDELNAQGHRLYGIANSDAHNVNKIGDPRIRAYLEELTQEEILDAMRSGRFYGTNGPELHFTIDGKRMGQDVAVPAGGAAVNITLGGADTEPLTSVQLIKNGTTVQTWAPDANAMSETISDRAVPGDFYRAVVETRTGYAFSNPIWIIATQETVARKTEN